MEQGVIDAATSIVLNGRKVEQVRKEIEETAKELEGNVNNTYSGMK